MRLTPLSILNNKRVLYFFHRGYKGCSEIFVPEFLWFARTEAMQSQPRLMPSLFMSAYLPSGADMIVRGQDDFAGPDNLFSKELAKG